MKVLFVLEYYYPNIGGVETLFKTLAEDLVKKGNEVKIVTMQFKSNLPRKETINGVQITRLKFTSRLTFALLSIPKVFNAAKGFDLIQTTSSSGGFAAVVVGKLLNKKIVVVFHELWGKLWFKLPFLNFLNRTFSYLSEQIIARLPYSKIIAVSNFTKESLEKAGVSPSKIIRIYNGLDYQKFKGFTHKPEKGSFTFTFFGRLGASKGIDVLLSATQMFFENRPDAKLKLIIPTIPRRRYNEVVNEIRKLNISDNVTILSNLRKYELYKQLCNSNCVVIPSYSEGFCFAATEAIAMQIPVISSDMGALKETVSGKYIKLQSLTTKELFNSLEQAYSGEWSISPIKKFELDEQVNAYEHLYKVIIGE